VAWQQELQSTERVHVEFHNLDLSSVPDEDFQQYMATLDTFQQPYSVSFEREFMGQLVNLKAPFKFHGIMILEDIQLNEEMECWWREL
jgi:NAD-dependent DNA ligase